ncbi:phosphotransferase [Sphaerisporangium sp. NPDC051011]|uniref:phosphotransferase n=1 Tax=Sphaerisporangium sp. NPDC051011 TaxID=3155792 RepID=UPI0033DAAA1A
MSEPADAGKAGRGGIAGSRLADVMQGFGLGQASSVSYLPSGMMNRNWRVETQQGVFALKELVDVPVPKARRSLDVLRALAADGLPVCSPHLTPHGDSVLEVDERAYCLLPWAHGVHREGSSLTAEEAAELGRLLGWTHQALAASRTGLESPAGRPQARVTTPETAAAEAERFLQLIAALDEPQTFDRAAARALEQRKELLVAHADDRPGDEVPAGPVGWTHGDFQPLNLLWDNDHVSAILDWDRLAVRPYGEEVVRTAQVQFTTSDGRLDLVLVAAFTAGYRAVVPLDDGDLADAVRRLWWKRASDFWQLQWHYDKGDHGPDELWVSGERLLHWWTPRRDQVTVAFTARR